MKITVCSIDEVAFDIGLPEEDILHLMSEGKFPLPIRFGKNLVGWLDSEIDDWVEETFASRTNVKEKVG